jgi:hypothetical protein
VGQGGFQVKRFKIIHLLAMLLVLAILFIPSCASLQGSVETPKDRALSAMAVYNRTFDNYVQQAARPDLTPAEKDVLKATRRALIDVYPVITGYVNYVETGQTPTPDMEAALMAAVDALTRAALEGVR